MIVTHTQNANGQQRLYLGGKSSVECWIEPQAHANGWSFHVDAAVTGNSLTTAEVRACAIHTLLDLAAELNVSPQDLAAVPFEAIAALHATDPFSGRRIATPRRKAIDNGFMATPPHIRRPATDFAANHARPRSNRTR